MSRAGIDIIVPCYNYGRYLAACTGSVLHETRLPIRVLIIDDASTDGSADEADRLAALDRRIVARRHATNQGHIATYNEGLDWVKAPYMLLLSADDVVAPGALARAVDLMEQDPEIAFVYGGARHFESDAELPPGELTSGDAVTIRAGEDFIRELCERPVNPVETATAVVRTDVQKAVGGYHPELPHSGDLEMWLRCAARGKVGVLAATQAFVRLHASNMRKTYFGANLVAEGLQRRHAYRLFFEGEGRRLPDAAALERQVTARLARDMFVQASSAFDNGRPYGELLSAAIELDPALARSPAFLKLGIKRALRRLLGERLWWSWQTPAGRRRLAQSGAEDAVEVSLIICTRNRARFLAPFLEALEALASRRRWEIVLVDNGSSDETWRTLSAFAQQAPAPVTLVREPRPGLAHARNAGVLAARGRILCFTDDDCYPRHDFIDAVAQAFDAHDVGFIGGQVLLHDPDDAPVCVTGSRSGSVFPAGSFISTGQIHGACMAFRREVFAGVGLFDVSFGAGAPLKGAEDCEFVARACFAGWSGGFFPGPVVYHHHRRRGRAAAEIQRGYDYSRGAFFAKLLLRQRARRRLVLKYWYWDTFARCASSSRALLKAWREVCGACRYALSYAWRPDVRPTLEAPGTAP